MPENHVEEEVISNGESSRGFSIPTHTPNINYQISSLLDSKKVEAVMLAMIGRESVPDMKPWSLISGWCVSSLSLRSGILSSFRAMWCLKDVTYGGAHTLFLTGPPQFLNNSAGQSASAEKDNDGEPIPLPGLTSAIYRLSMGNSDLIGGDGWTSFLAEVPIIMGNNGNISSAS
ncbi:hypothetical protein Tco_0950172 [Tanacetum coccineum]